ncbi:MAG: hypothetical protein AAGA22_01155 [Pseudomonadota bacterium]
MATEKFVRVIVFKDGEDYFAQCLEYDIFARGEDEQSVLDKFAAKYNFEHNLSIERAGAPFANIDPAPDEFFAMWESCEERDKLHAIGTQVSVGKLLEAA